LHTPILDIKSFNKNINDLGYDDFTSNFVVKQFDNIIINITRNNEEIVAITAYNEDQDIIDIPTQILQQVKQDITNSNK
jgi:hypothetical protein